MQLSQVPLRLELNHFVFLRRWLQQNAGSALKRGGRIERKGPKALPCQIVECGIPQQTVPNPPAIDAPSLRIAPRRRQGNGLVRAWKTAQRQTTKGGPNASIPSCHIAACLLTSFRVSGFPSHSRRNQLP